MRKLAFALALIASPAFAQQQQTTAPEVALQINSVIGGWAQTIVQQNRQIEMLTKQLVDAQAKIEELKVKDKPDTKQ